MICQVIMILARGSLFMSQTREKFATQVNSKILRDVRALADEEGRQLQALVDAALWESLAQNHSFVDGNKRTAFAATYTFLAINALYFTADAEETYVFVSNLYWANQFRFDKLVPWLRAHVEKRT